MKSWLLLFACNLMWALQFFGLPIAAIWLGERLAPQAIVGGLLVFGSTLLITVGEDLRRKPATT